MNFGSDGTLLKFTVLAHFGAQFTAGKPKTLLKAKISAKTASLQIINNVSPRSQKNHIVLVKLSQKDIVWATILFKIPPCSRAKGSSQILTYSSIIGS